MKTTIDKAGRLVIPKEIRQKAGLEPGMEVKIRCNLDEGQIEIVLPRAEGRIVYENGLACWESGRKFCSEEIDDAIREMREERGDRIIRGMLGLDED
jgi:AbrB family looped-hinge helix DNA binding protein